MKDGDILFPLCSELSSPSREMIELSISLALARLDRSSDLECSCACLIFTAYLGDSCSSDTSRFACIIPLSRLGNNFFAFFLLSSLEHTESSCSFLKIDGATAVYFRPGDSEVR